MNDVLQNELLSAYLDGELTAGEQAQVERLLAENPAAKQLLDELRTLSATLGSMPRLELGHDIAEQVIRRATAEKARRRSIAARRASPGATWILSGLAVAAAVLLVVMFSLPHEERRVVMAPPAAEGPAAAAQEVPAAQPAFDVIVECNISSEADGKRAFDRLLAERRIAGHETEPEQAGLGADGTFGGALRDAPSLRQKPPHKDERPSRTATQNDEKKGPEQRDRVYFEAPESQLRALLAALRARPEAFQVVSLQRRSHGQMQPDSTWLGEDHLWAQQEGERPRPAITKEKAPQESDVATGLKLHFRREASGTSPADLAETDEPGPGKLGSQSAAAASSAAMPGPAAPPPEPETPDEQAAKTEPPGQPEPLLRVLIVFRVGQLDSAVTESRAAEQPPPTDAAPAETERAH